VPIGEESGDLQLPAFLEQGVAGGPFWARPFCFVSAGRVQNVLDGVKKVLAIVG